MEQKKIEHITLNLIVFSTIAIISVLACQIVLHYGWDEFSSYLFWLYAPLSWELSISIYKWYSDNSFPQQ